MIENDNIPFETNFITSYRNLTASYGMKNKKKKKKKL